MRCSSPKFVKQFAINDELLLSFANGSLINAAQREFARVKVDYAAAHGIHALKPLLSQRDYNVLDC